MKFITSSAIVALLFLSSVGMAAAADGVLYVMPERGVYSIGDTFDVQVLVDTGGVSINAAEAELTFDPAGLSVEHISVDGSILGSWPTKPVFSNTDGTIAFTGWTRGTFSGKDGLLVTITFRALHDMTSNARFAAGAILAAGGGGSNIISSMKSATFTVRPQPTIPSSEDDTAPPDDTGAVMNNTIAAPTFVEYESTVNVGERIFAKGSVPSDAKVLVWLQHGSEQPQRSVVMSGVDGSFTFVSDNRAQEGVYHIWAQVEDVAGAHSPSSQKIKIVANASSLTASAQLVGDIMIGLLPYVLLFAFVGLGIGYIVHRHRIEKMRHSLQA